MIIINELTAFENRINSILDKHFDFLNQFYSVEESGFIRDIEQITTGISSLNYLNGDDDKVFHQSGLTGTCIAINSILNNPATSEIFHTKYETMFDKKI